MKILIVDYSNEGVIYVGDNIIVANQLKKGLVDADTKILLPHHVGYEKITRQNIYEQNKHYWINRAYMIKDLLPTAQNSVYLERRELVKLRYPLMDKLFAYIGHISRKTKFSPYDGFENNLALALQRCNPDTDSYCDEVQEYAQICGLDTFSAFREIKLQVDNIQSIKMRIYAFMQYFAQKINEVATEESKKNIDQEMTDKFYRDTSI